MPHPTALLALSLIQWPRRLQISRVKNFGNVSEISGVSFRLAPPYGLQGGSDVLTTLGVCYHVVKDLSDELETTDVYIHDFHFFS